MLFRSRARGQNPTMTSPCSCAKWAPGSRKWTASPISARSFEAGERRSPEKGARVARQASRDARQLLARRSESRGYLAGLHAAQALIFETSGKITKSHERVQAEIGRGTKDDSRFDRELGAFLDRAYDLKSIADYETGPGSLVSAETASAAIVVAHPFVDFMGSVMRANGQAQATATEVLRLAQKSGFLSVAKAR